VYSEQPAEFIAFKFLTHVVFFFFFWFLFFVCRYVATDIPSDLLVQVGGVNFHLHKVVDLLSNPKYLLQNSKFTSN
jgi:hypothetical protein